MVLSERKALRNVPNFAFGITAAEKSVDLRLLAIARLAGRTCPSNESDGRMGLHRAFHE